MKLFTVFLLCLFSLGALAELKTAPKGLEKVYQANEELHQAFFKYDAQKVQEKSSLLKDAIESLEDQDVKKKLVFSAKKLAEMKKEAPRSENNQNYHLVSMALIHVMNNYDVGENYKAFQCPMVKKKWIQDVSDEKMVKNPYAPEMPNCGSLAK